MPSLATLWRRRHQGLSSVAAAVTLTLTLTLAYSDPSTNFLQDPELMRLGLSYKVLPPPLTVTTEGSSVSLPCQPIEMPWGTAKLTWKIGVTDVNDHRRQVLPNGTLLITDVVESDAGLYNCVLTAGNFSVSSAFRYIKLQKQDKEQVWQLRPENISVPAGHLVRLNCYRHSIPEATYTWLHNGHSLPANDSRYIHVNPNVLHILQVTPQDEGEYRCRAVNPSLRKEYLSPPGYLNVSHGNPLVTNSSTMSTPFPVQTNVEAHVGGRAVLECISNYENPKMEWSRLDQVPIPENRRKLISQGSLVILNVKAEDKSVYNCTAIGSNGQNTTTMIDLNVLTQPSINMSMNVNNREVSLNMAINNGQMVRITCMTWGTPRPIINWFKNGIQIVTSRRHLLKKNSNRDISFDDLCIDHLMSVDMGVYQCVARSSSGIASKGFILNIIKPDNLLPPSNIKVEKVGLHYISLKWSKSLNQSNSHYIVMFYTDNSDVEGQVLVNATTSVTLDNLDSNTSYIVYIRSISINNTNNSHQFSEPSRRLTITTSSEYPMKVPVVRLFPKSYTELYVNWTHDDYYNNNPITQQVIQWKLIRKHYLQEQKLPGNITSFVLDDLLPRKKYLVRVLVSTSAGYPQHVQQLPWVPIEMPGRPSNHHNHEPLTLRLSTCSENPTQILVNWILSASLRSEVSGFHIYCNDSLEEFEKYLGPTSTTLVLSDLEPRACYTVRVRATFSSGRNSTDSPTKSLCTLPLLLSTSQQSNTNDIKVKKLRSKVLNTTSVVVSWRNLPRHTYVSFYTIRVENVKSSWESYTGPLHIMNQEEDEEEDDKELLGVADDKMDDGGPQPLSEAEAVQSMDGNSDVDDGYSYMRYHRVTERRLVITGLKPLRNYSVTVSASYTTTTSTFTGPSVVIFITPEEGVPTQPLNVSWSPFSPKDAKLLWSPPRFNNGRLISYFISFSHDEQEWRNKTVSAFTTTTTIEDLVSNTNYTLHIAGVTNKGIGAATTVFIYIRATLEGGEPQITTKLVVVSVVSLLAVVTCIVAVLLGFKILHLRRNPPSRFQGNGTCRMVCANGVVKSPGRDHGTEPDDYKPMLASLPPATQNHHLDTKGGPGLLDEGLVTNSLSDNCGMQMDQADGAMENAECLHDSSGQQQKLLETYEDVDNGDDASCGLLQNMSSGKIMFSKNVNEFIPHSQYNASSQAVDPNHLPASQTTSSDQTATS